MRQAAASGSHDMDAETLEYIQQIFQLVRSGDAARLSDLLQRGLPPNLRNHKGDSPLMLARYHGHVDAARALLEYGRPPYVARRALRCIPSGRSGAPANAPPTLT